MTVSSLPNPALPNSAVPNQVLSELKPLILPIEPGNWPPAVGWWLLALVLIIAIVLSVKALISHYKFWAMRRHNLAKAKRTDCPSQLNRLLKITALHYFPSEQVANLSGTKWATFLKQNLAPSHHDNCDLCCALLYQNPNRTSDDSAHQLMFQPMAIAWLSGLSRKKIKAYIDV